MGKRKKKWEKDLNRQHTKQDIQMGNKQYENMLSKCLWEITKKPTMICHYTLIKWLNSKHSEHQLLVKM